MIKAVMLDSIPMNFEEDFALYGEGLDEVEFIHHITGVFLRTGTVVRKHTVSEALVASCVINDIISCEVLVPTEVAKYLKFGMVLSGEDAIELTPEGYTVHEVFPHVLYTPEEFRSIVDAVKFFASNGTVLLPLALMRFDG
jgi:hypothetical protein